MKQKKSAHTHSNYYYPLSWPCAANAKRTHSQYYKLLFFLVFFFVVDKFNHLWLLLFASIFLYSASPAFGWRPKWLFPLSVVSVRDVLLSIMRMCESIHKSPTYIPIIIHVYNLYVHTGSTVQRSIGVRSFRK